MKEVFNFSLCSGESCGGLLRGNSGGFELKESLEMDSNCVWVIELVSRNQIFFELDSLSEGSKLNLYAQVNPQELYPKPTT